MVCPGQPLHPLWNQDGYLFTGLVEEAIYFEEIRVFQAGFCLNTSAWNNGIGRCEF